MVARAVVDAGIERREDEGRVPVEAVGLLPGPIAGADSRPRRCRSRGGPCRRSGSRSRRARGWSDRRCSGSRRHRPRGTTPRWSRRRRWCVRGRPRSRCPAGRRTRCRTLAGHRDVVELAEGELVVVVPVGHPIAGHVDAAVVAQDDVASVGRIHPEGVMVDVDGAVVAVVREGRAAVAGAMEPRAQHVDVALVTRVHADLAVVHRARVERVDPRPGRAAVGRLEDAAVLVALGALLVLGVGALAAEPDAEGTVTPAPVDVEALLLLLGATVEGDLQGRARRPARPRAARRHPRSSPGARRSLA